MSELTQGTRVKLTITQTCILLGGVISFTYGAGAALHEIRSDIKEIRKSEELHTAQIEGLRQQIAANELASANRREEWGKWRWFATWDILDLADTTHTKVFTKPPAN